MQSLTTTSLRIRENQLWILDQQALPQQSDWRECRDVSELVDHIRTLRVRGAPLIGLSASLLLALLAWIIDAKDKKRWSVFFESFGINFEPFKECGELITSNGAISSKIVTLKYFPFTEHGHYYFFEVATKVINTGISNL